MPKIFNLILSWADLECEDFLMKIVLIFLETATDYCQDIFLVLN